MPASNAAAPILKKSNEWLPLSIFSRKEKQKDDTPVTKKNVGQEKTCISFSSLVFSIELVLQLTESKKSANLSFAYNKRRNTGSFTMGISGKSLAGMIKIWAVGSLIALLPKKGLQESIFYNTGGNLLRH
jgi:hypothetical protein